MPLSTTSSVEPKFETTEPPPTIFSEPNKESTVPPEGGRDGWLCVVGATIGLFCTFGFLNAWVLNHNFTPDGSLT